MPMRPEVIRFDAEPVKVRLDKGPQAGIECHGQYGIDWRYSVNNGKALIYLPAEGRDALLCSGVAAGEEVGIRRFAKGRWEVERIAPDLAFPSYCEGPKTKGTNEVVSPRSATRPLPDRLFARPEPQKPPAEAAPAAPEPVTLPDAAVTASNHMMSCYSWRSMWRSKSRIMRATKA